tara:strand:+ start:273 stop:893 length:621 start_codon:yes stop_codon:yes gene_type:complete
MSFKYKLVKNPLTGEIDSITHNISSSHKQSIPIVVDNMEYQQFVDDIYENGLGIVEGADYVGVVSYTDARRAEYPPLEEQLDKIYHNGINAWKAEIKVIKDKYPKTQIGITSIAPLPDWINAAIFDKQKEKYLKAVARLAQPRLKLGTPTTESVWNVGIQDYADTIIYKNVPDPNDPAVVKDEAARDAAQTIIDNTPQSVIDSINT